MKHYYIILSFLIPFSVICWGQKVRILPLGCELKDFSIENNERGELLIISTNQVVTYKSDLTAPALPYINVKVLVAPSEEYESATLTGNDILIRENIKLSANPLSLPGNETLKELSTPNDSYYIEDTYPNQSLEFIGACIMGGYKMLSFMVAPFKYDDSKKQLFFKKDIKITLLTRGKAFGGVSGPMHSYVKKIVVNANEAEKIYNCNAAKKAQAQQSSDYPLYEYIIVTSATLKPAFQRLADWKTRKGVATKILTTEEIYTDYSGQTLQSKIKKALKSYYDSTQQALTYVLLGGDVDIVPSQKCYVKYWYNAPYTVYETYTPTDLFYACFDTMDWDCNGNGIYGEINDNVDIVPEIFVTRASVRNVSEVEIFVNRIIAYESNPKWNSYNNKILMSGSMTHGYYYENTISDAQYKSEWLYHDYIEPYWNGTKVRFYDTDTDFGGAGYQVYPTNLQTQLGNNYGFVHIETHGRPTGWDLENSTFYDTSYSDLLNNINGTIVLTAACHTNAFDSLSTCLSESFIRNPESGILAYVGSSRYSWYQPGISYLGPSNTLNGEIFKKMFSQGDNNFGKIVAEAKNALETYAYTYEDMYRWLLFSVNPMGDPEMPIYTSIPKTFNDINVSCNGNTLSVDANTPGCKICITGRSNGIFLLMKNTSTYTSPTLLDGEYNVCITKPGYVPYNMIVGINQDVYIQNESFVSSVDVSNPNVYIGKDVNPSAAQGPVSIKDGSVRIALQNSVLIKNDFEVKEGATFEIKQ